MTMETETNNSKDNIRIQNSEKKKKNKERETATTKEEQFVLDSRLLGFGQMPGLGAGKLAIPLHQPLQRVGPRVAHI